ncbi:hypothetical protein KCU64_g84, partial [Aureobasidium melanogenum]
MIGVHQVLLSRSNRHIQSMIIHLSGRQNILCVVAKQSFSHLSLPHSQDRLLNIISLLSACRLGYFNIAIHNSFLDVSGTNEYTTTQSHAKILYVSIQSDDVIRETRRTWDIRVPRVDEGVIVDRIGGVKHEQGADSRGLAHGRRALAGVRLSSDTNEDPDDGLSLMDSANQLPGRSQVGPLHAQHRMASLTDPMATSAGMALPSVVTAGGRVITLAPEIVDVILELLDDGKGALSRMMCTSKSMFDHTIKFFWKTATLEMLNKLSSTPFDRRQRYAGAIREINITIGPYQILPPLHGNAFPQLERLAILYRSMPQLDWRHVFCHVDLAHLMVSTLTEVRITQISNADGRFGSARLSIGTSCPISLATALSFDLLSLMLKFLVPPLMTWSTSFSAAKS